MYSSGLFPNIISYTQQVVSMFGTTHHSEQFFFSSKMKHAKISLRPQVSNHQLSDELLLSTASFNLDIISFYYSK